MLKKIIAASLTLAALGCSKDNPDQQAAEMTTDRAAIVLTDEKPVIYQVLPRLFGNTNATNKPWGTIEENGVGKFNDFSPEALKEIRALGSTYIWYTGSLHHAVVRDYTAYDISNDDPDVVKAAPAPPTRSRITTA